MTRPAAQPATTPQPAGPLWPVAAYFLHLGACGFGGPIALAARMQRDWVERRSWITDSEYLEGLAFAQLAPGPLAAQLAMYLGYLYRGIAGASVAGLSFVLPSFLMVLALAVAYVRYGALAWVQNSFYAVGPCVIGVIAIAAYRLSKRVLKRDRMLLGIFLIAAAWTAITQRELVTIFLAAGAATLIQHNWRSRIRPSLPAFLTGAVAAAPPTAGSLPLLLYFAKAGMFVFGSGLAIVPFLYAGVVQEHRWLTDRQFLDAVAVAMITPGPVVITVAFIGYLVGGLKGALAAAAGIFAPVYLMVVLLAPLFRRHASSPQLRAFVAGVTAAAVGAIAGAVVVLGQRTIHDRFGIALAAATVVLLLRWKLPEPALIAAAALLGLFIRGGA